MRKLFLLHPTLFKACVFGNHRVLEERILFARDVLDERYRYLHTDVGLPFK